MNSQRHSIRVATSLGERSTTPDITPGVEVSESSTEAVPLDQTVVARLTAQGQSALATIAIDGPRAIQIASKLFVSAAKQAIVATSTGHYYGNFGHPVVDDVVLAVTHPNRSVEIHSHGGTAVVEALVGQIQAAGATVVPWSQLLGRQGWHQTRIEAAEALANCHATQAAAVLLDQLNGSLETAFREIESTGDRDLASKVLQWACLGRHLTQPWRVVLLGQPNVGKSSLFNAIMGFDRVITAPEAGTTRDVIEANVSLGGWPFCLIDGAGIRDSTDALEQTGVELIRESAKRADLRVFVRDLSTPPSTKDDLLIRSFTPDLIIGGKSDLPSPWQAIDLSSLNCVVSATTGDAVQGLIDQMVRAVVPIEPAVGQAVPFTERHVDWLRHWLAERS